MDRAIGYIRVSTGKQVKGTSLTEQRERIEKFCRDASMELLEIVCDEGVSGGVKAGDVFGWESRPSLMRIMDRAKAGDFNNVVVAKFDRLARDHVTQVTVRRMLACDDVELHSASEQNGDSAEAKLQETIMAGVAEYERHMIRERLRLGKARRKGEGRHVHGRVPYGYRSDAGKLLALDDEAAIVAIIFGAAAKGASSGQIAAQLTAQGSKPRLAEAWSPVSVRSVLKNDVYLGTKYGVQGAHDALVTRRTWTKAQATLAANRKR